MTDQLDEATRKHFKMAADTLKQIEDPEKRKEHAKVHAELFAKQNAQFDRGKFMVAAGVKEEVEEDIEDINEDHNHSDTDLHPQAKSLILYGDNDGHLERSSRKPIVKNLAKKISNGTYEHEKAKKLWGYHADKAAQSYTKEHGHAGQKWHELFSTKHRKQAAAHWADEHHAGVLSGDQAHMYKEETAAEIVYAAMGKKPLDVNTNFKEAVLERSKGIIDNKKGELAGNFMESFKLNPAKKGMWDGFSKNGIRKAETVAKNSGDITKEREAVFALNAKNHFKKGS